MTQPLIKLGRSYDVCFSRDGARVATVGDGLKVWNVATRELVLKSRPLPHCSSLDFSPASDWLALKNTAGSIVVFDQTQQKPVCDFKNKKEGEGANVLFSPCGNYVIDASWEGYLRVRDIASGKIEYEHFHPNSMVTIVATSRTRDQFIYCVQARGERRDIYVHRLKWPVSGAPELLFERQVAYPIALRISPSGTRLAFAYLAVGGEENGVEFRDLASLQVVQRSVQKVSYSDTALDWSPDESLFGCATGDAVVFYEGPAEKQKVIIPLKYSCAIRFSPTEPVVALGGWERGQVSTLDEILK